MNSSLRQIHATLILLLIYTATSLVQAQENEKPGKCKDYNVTVDPQSCAGVEPQCLNDADCSGNEKCCTIGCEKSCLPPILPNIQSKKCTTNPTERKICGPTGVTKSSCEDLGCCFNDSVVRAHSCFKGICAQHVDLVFAIDASGSIKEKGFQQIKEFTKSLVDGFDVGVDKTHVGVVTFSQYAEVQINLTESFRRDELYNKIDNLRYAGYQTATDDALRIVNNEVFTLAGGVRQGVPQVLIFLTDGKCTLCEGDITDIVTPLKDRGVTIYTVGITDNINRTELEIISSNPSAQHMFEVESINKLKEIILQLNEKSCIVKKGKCAKPIPPFQCNALLSKNECDGDGMCSGNQKCCHNGCAKKCQFPLANCLTAIDVAFALDSSPSTDSSVFTQMKRMAMDIVDSFQVSQRDARFASLVYSGTGKVNFNFVQHDTVNAIKQAIKSMRYGDTSTSIAKALEIAKSDIFSLQGKVRTRRPMVLVVFINSNAEMAPEELEEFAVPLKEYGVKVIAISVGSSSNIGEIQLNQIAYLNNSLFEANTFQEILPKLYSIAKEACNEKPGKCEIKNNNFTSQSCEDGVVNECANDFDCYGNAKCCKTVCKRKCVLPASVCRRKIDIAFAVNENMKPNEYEGVKFFLQSVIDRFNVSPDGTHIALITYGIGAKLVFDFNNIQKWNDNLKSKIGNLELQNGAKGKLEDVLIMSCDSIFCTTGGSRGGVPKMLVLVTGPMGISEPEKVKEMVSKLRNKGVHVVAIGVGDVNTTVLQSITTTIQDTDDRVWLSKYFSGVSQYVQDVADFACKATATTGNEESTGESNGNGKCGSPKTCIKGPKGSRGRPGKLGERGPTGPRGEPGPQGIPGPKGPANVDGRMGEKGERGLKGLIGLPGFPGFNGVHGVPGVAGRPGIDGDCGFPGQPGEAGSPGVNGFPGATGKVGPVGEKGRKGEPAKFNPDLTILPGDDGDPGEDGSPGEKGEKGDSGITGDEGDDGFDGDFGPVGQPGEMGDLGSNLVVKGEKGHKGDTGAPGPNAQSATAGDNKDAIVQGPKGIGGLKGEKGDKGKNGTASTVKGAKGPQGIQGQKGSTGEDGKPGPKGETGIPGEVGLEGQKGNQGSQGEEGRRGNKGATGNQGLKGFVGTRGNRGQTGEPIPSQEGRKGPSGDKGLPGAEGSVGSQGSVGPNGPPGETGKMGEPGDDGSTGERGETGQNGIPGMVGMIGVAGEKGELGEPGAKGDPGKNAVLRPGKPGMDGPPGERGVTGSQGDPGPAGPPGPAVEVNCIENICPLAYKGNQGSPGVTGENGKPGGDGSKGLKGFPGGPCPQCPVGPSGDSGDIGEPGQPGSKGDQGQIGDIGEAGLKGSKGLKGAKGGMGIKGVKGLKGENGTIGAQGPDSPKNSTADKGDKGSPGNDGAAGKPGADGKRGSDGPKGAEGPRGRRGSEGQKGDVGSTGARGMNGTSGRSGEVGEKGEEGLGLTGEEGSEGEQGPIGLDGEPGAKGRKGEPGVAPTGEEMQKMKQKMAGDTGDQGPTGELGLLGPIGPSGEIGPRGVKGFQGIAGPKGYGGVKGNVGLKGKSGDDGDPGNRGKPGRIGSRGPPGENGKPGEAASEPKGEKGDVGDSGPPGQRGLDAPPPPGCFNLGNAADIGFVMDSSKSVNEEDFNRQREFINKIIEQFQVSQDEMQAGVIKYGETAGIEIAFSEFNTAEDISRAVTAIEHDLAKESRLDLALKVARDQLFTKEAGARSDDAKVEKALVILGDGFISGGGERSRDLMQSATQYAEDLRAEGVLIFTLAVGTEINKLLLKNFATKDKYYIEVESYTALTARIGELKDSLSAECSLEGEVGRDGFPGIAGPKGFAGEKGLSGNSPPGKKGSVGPKGIKGEPGFGINGPDGDKGSKGQTGDKGIDGITGASERGKDGPKGQKGESGVLIPGTKGDPGERGPQGAKGSDANQKLCNKALATDIVFLLDTSSGVGIDNFQVMLEYVRNIVQAFDVDNFLTRVGVITYDADARLDIPLSAYNRESDLLDAIYNLRYENGEFTRIDLALDLASKEAFLEENGARSDDSVIKAVVLMTDGQQSYAPDAIELEDAVDALEQQGILRYAVGIGSEISNMSLQVIAGENTVFAEDFGSLMTKIEDQIGLIGTGGCKGSEGTPGQKGETGDIGFKGQRGDNGIDGFPGPEGPPGPKGIKGERGIPIGDGRKGDKGETGDPGPIGLPACTEEQNQNTPTDLVFMLDASASLIYHGFQKEVKFVNNVIEKVGPLHPDNLRSGVVVYGENATIRIKLNDYFDTQAFQTAVSDLVYDESSITRIDLGLNKSKEAFKVENGGRGSSKKVLILLTDGQQSFVPFTDPPEIIAKELAADGVDVFSIGIGEEIDRVELESLISNKEHIFLATDLDLLTDMLVDEISQALTCEGGPRGEDGVPGSDGAPGERGDVGAPGNPGPQGNRGEPGRGPDGEVGDLGPQGPQGDPGEKGFRGPPGKQGTRGEIGLKGFQGSKGERGDPGEMGFFGVEGEPGDVGPKGQKGDPIGDGNPGEPGPPGEPGVKGYTGDPGVLPPGNELKDLIGDPGDQGTIGDAGNEGPKGSILVAPGPIGLRGLRGDKGIPGLFGGIGEIGKKGQPGPKGETGFSGIVGLQGPPGFPGKMGVKGTVGERGDSRKGVKGDRGDLGRIGEVGDIGQPGPDGDFGFLGMDGNKGDRGNRGRPGPQQLPKAGMDMEFKGESGEKGRIGEAGETGEPGEPGIITQRQGIKGEKGINGDIGDPGSKGDSGFPGPIGMPGPKGFTGRAGTGGNPGQQGPKGKKGEMGPVIGGGEFGDVGELGDLGLKGRPGIKGASGGEGDFGEKGPNGNKGLKGDNGFPGLTGSQGPDGKPGERGVTGDKGVTGVPGLGGPAGEMGTTKAFGYYFVKHSQRSGENFIPSCPRNYEVLWEGYSLMYTVGNGHAHSQDLGDAGSCSKSFSTLPFLFCGITGNCQYAQRNDFTYWLSGDVTQSMMPVSSSAIEPFVSRCVVCKAPDITLAVHSQDVSRPDCPTGFESLWTGYSFLMVAAAGKTGAGQSLSSTGSCLEEFRAKPFIECQGARGTCHFFSDKFSFWLVTVEPSKQFQEQEPQTLSATKGDDLTSRVSRCRVCLRTGLSDDGNSLESGNAVRRIARSLKKFFLGS